MTVSEVSDRINNEGLGYAIQHYMRGKDIKDPVLAKMWDEAAALLNKIEEYVQERNIDEG